MDIRKVVTKKIFWLLTIIGVLAAAIVSAGIYFGLEQFFIRFSKDAGNEILAGKMVWIIEQLEFVSMYFYKIVLPAVIGISLIAAWKLWFVLKITISGSLKTFEQELDQAQSSGKKKKDFIDQKIEQDRKRRLFLHTLSVFQREGRLLDFFDEDLNDYDDEQIGAAVRAIQEDCKKAVKKYINPQPVIDSEEGETVTIEKGFDIDAVKLVGKVSGEPPFEGVLSHGGWKAGKKEIPKLSDIQDSTIIIPAEVEIQ